jgi:iron complex outermembrane receptor protein
MLTVVGNYNNIKFNNPGTVTQAQINRTAGTSASMPIPLTPTTTTTPTITSRSRRTSNTLASRTKLGERFRSLNKVYTYAYNNDSHEKPADPMVGGTTKFPGTTALYTGWRRTLRQ